MIKHEDIVEALCLVNWKILNRFPHLAHREEEIYSAVGAGIAKAIQEYDQSRNDNVLKWLVWAGVNRTIDILRSPSERLLENRSYEITERIRRFNLINESDYFEENYYSFDYTFPKKEKKQSEQQAEEEIHKFIMDAIEDLPDKDKEVFSTCHVDGYSGDDTAEIQAVTTKRVYYVNCKVKKKLQKYFETNGKNYPIVWHTFSVLQSREIEENEMIPQK